MRKIIITSLFFGLLFTACQNENAENSKSIEMTEIKDNAISEKEADTKSKEDLYSFDYLYKSDNGEIMDVTFFEENGKMFVRIKRDEHEEITLTQTTAWAKGAEYENNNFKWKTQESRATFSTGKEEMELTVISPLQYRYANDEEEIVVIYFDKDDKRFVTIKKDNEPEVTLEQTSAWSKGAEYGVEEIKWNSNGENGILDEDGIKSEFKRRD